MKHQIIIGLLFLFMPCLATAQDISIEVNALEGQHAISPYIYGKNNNFSDQETTPLSSYSFYKDVGLRFARENSGNNATKYNWRKKLTSHPDWYNNVYPHDWDMEAQHIFANMPNLQVMYGFQLLGKAASNTNNNFNDWSYNRSQWWEGVTQNLAGGGEAETSGGSSAKVEGNPDLYLMDWNADSTTTILSHWFNEDGLNFPQKNLQYWSMDNEPEIWAGTHDDVMSSQPSADAFIQQYIDVAKKARALYPDIKLCGPVVANEWQWYKYDDDKLTIAGNYYCWLEYFIKRIAEEQASSGVRLLDVLDIHWYPGESSATDVVQLHRVFYDQSYAYPGANGVKTINDGWDDSQTKEFIFKRIEDWLTTHFGENHGIALGLTEFGTNTSDVNVNSVLYASMLGTFANNRVELFSPWYWHTGMWETLHLFSRYAKPLNVASTSSNEEMVSAYSSMNLSSDSLTVIVVNRSTSSSTTVNVNINNFNVDNGNYTTLQLASLPNSETFVSHTQNALINNTILVSQQAFSITLPALSTTAVLLKGSGSLANQIQKNVSEKNDDFVRIYPNPTNEMITVEYPPSLNTNINIQLIDSSGKLIKTYSSISAPKSTYPINTASLAEGFYFVKINIPGHLITKKFIIVK